MEEGKGRGVEEGKGRRVEEGKGRRGGQSSLGWLHYQCSQF